MTSRERLEGYLAALHARLRALIYTRAAAVAGLGILVFTVAWVTILNRDGFPASLAIIGRVLLATVLIVIAIALVWVPLRKLSRNDGANEIERRLPAQRGRIQTYLEARKRESEGIRSPLLDLLASDAARLAGDTPIEKVIPGPRIWMGGAIAVVSALVLLLLLVAGPAHWGYGTRYLLLGAELPRTAVPVRKIGVTPGDATIRRNSDVAIHAAVEGFRPEEAQVFVRFDGEEAWQRAPMQVVQESEQAKWEFKLYAVRGPLRYYVQAANARSSEKSAEHSIGVVDLPHIERVRLTYDYPEWTDLPERIEETIRDIRAVPGTGVKLEVFASAALDSPVIVVDGQPVEMNADGGVAAGSIKVSNAGSYRISARVANELVALTDDYSIELVNDEKPTIDIEKPGRDWHATSIEEVPVRINAQDDFRLQDVELRYAVNGGAWQTLDVARGGKQARSESLLKLEELGAQQPALQPQAPPTLAPGDLVSYYAVAKDRNESVQTDLFMVQVQPFERRFTQGQGGGGGGDGAAEEQGAISERQREILLATWNLQRSDGKATRTRKQLEESAKMLSEMQALLAQQARTLSERTRARLSLEEDERIKQFVESLDQAADVMDPAARHLEDFKLADAIPVEQQALQQLLRAESAFREVQVSMQQNGSGGSAGQQAARNFTEMFELEMDVDKNHYETESQLAKESKKEELDDAVRKLKELAERQEKLAQEAQRAAVPEREQRWRQEQLRREAEDLRRQLAELQKSQQGSQSGSQNSQGREGQSQQQAEQMANAVETMRRALDDMRAASSGQQGSSASGPSSQSAREASRKLRQALDQIDKPAGQGLAEQLEEFAARSEKLAAEQRRAESELHDAIDSAQQDGLPRGQLDPKSAARLTQTKQKMANEIRSLQQELRNAMNDNRAKQPATTEKLSEIVNDLENTNVVARISRSAQEIQYGRARDAASREGLIADVLEELEKGLRETARMAAGEGAKDTTPADPEGLLAELGDLRRALQEAKAGQGKAAQGQRQGDRTSEQPGGKSEGQGQGRNQQPGSSSQQQSADANAGDASEGGRGAWNSAWSQGSWNPGRIGSIGPLETDAAQFRRDAAQVAERVRQLAERMDGRELSAAEVRALQRMAHELRSLAGDPMARQTQALAKLVDQIELATLAAAEKVRSATPAHTAASAAEESRYRETVAEYYRRLGGSE